MQKQVDTLLYPRWIVPIEPHNVFLENHALAIDAGKILDILPADQAKQKYQSTNTQHLTNHVVMPGLINMHAHSPMVLLRGLADDLALMDWLQNHIWPAEAKWANEEFVYDGTQLAILEMLRGGTTCFNDHYFHSISIGKAAQAAGMRAFVGLWFIDFPTGYAKVTADYMARAEETYQYFQNDPLVQTCLAPHAPYTVSDASFALVKAFSEKHNLNVHLHLHETADEINQGLKQYNKRPLQRIAELGLVTPKFQCVHMTQITDEDIAILQKGGAHVVHCPESNLKLASGFCPVQKLLDANINVALATDGAASNNDLDMFGEMHVAAILAKSVAQDPTALNAATALKMATLNGARALGIADQVGSLVPGKFADLIAVDLSAYNTQPAYNPISHLVYAVNSHQVSDVWVAGKQLLKNGNFTTLDADAILAKTNQWRDKIVSSRTQ
jgi:5-methylthioadenosine/S-adenosylhomocysteine deaminase